MPTSPQTGRWAFFCSEQYCIMTDGIIPVRVYIDGMANDNTKHVVLLARTARIQSPPFSTEARHEVGRLMRLNNQRGYLMDAAKRKKLEAAGYAVYDDVADWLGMDE